MKKQSYLGENIEYLRQRAGIKNRADFGKIFGLTGKDIKSFEIDRAVPSEEELKEISAFFNVDVYILIHERVANYVSSESATDLTNNHIDKISDLFPLAKSFEALNNPHFKKGYECEKQLLKSKLLDSEYTIPSIMEEYSAAFDDGIPEAAINNLPLLIIIGSASVTPDKESIVEKIKGNNGYLKADIINHLRGDLIRGHAVKAIDHEDFGRDSFCEEFQAIINVSMSIPEYRDLANYYLALLYLFGLDDTGLPDATSYSFGQSLMLAYKDTGNPYAENMIKLFFDK